MRRRVVVTGLGAVTPAGNTVADTWEALLAGRSGIRRITAFDPSAYRGQIAGEVRDFDASEHMDAREVRRTDRATHFAVAATREAITDARLNPHEWSPDRVGVILGTAVGGLGTVLAQAKVLAERGPDRISPFMGNGLPDAPSSQIALSFHAKGPSMTIVAACASGTKAIGEAAETIRRGFADVMLTGGTDAMILPLILGGFSAGRALATDNEHPERACKPFDLHRDGFVVGEGAATLVLESEEHALARDAHIYAEVLGYGSSNDAYHLSAPAEHGAGIALAMSMALKDACIHPQDVGYINAHGTGTRANDRSETDAIKTILGEHAYRVPVSSIKALTGHLMGAAGAVEAIASILALRDGILPPTCNLDTPDPECDLDYVPNKARPADIHIALSNSIGLGGHNASVVFRR